ncbi:RloB family protein [Clostridium ljungdahlii]|uniref:RloB-like protein n=1 Tax=Clostridium ljungdahlii TaxID=1538 RepID=A0A166S7G7_9CLOT|nr:RloB family protein [Clostridium ljungdahlii]OAA91758.1 hypothetical protein WY13_00401 [Clostridium ljungdahlii]
MAVKRKIVELSRDKRKKRKIRPTILIICEGKDTEVNYFKEFNLKYVNVDVKVADSKSVGKNKSRKTDPSHLVDKAIEFIENKYDISEDDGDRVWCLIDVDIDYNTADPTSKRAEELEKAYIKVKRYAKGKKVFIHLGLSNPCFELWYLLHYTYTIANLKSYDALKIKLEKETPLKDYEKNKSVYNIIVDHTNQAIENSFRLNKHHKDLGKTLIDYSKAPPELNIKNIVESNPNTRIGELVKYIEDINKE